MATLNPSSNEPTSATELPQTPPPLRADAETDKHDDGLSAFAPFSLASTSVRYCLPHARKCGGS